MPAAGKSHRGAVKRFKRTGTGKITHRKMNNRHILTHKSAKRKRRFSGNAVLSKSMQRNVTRLLGKNG